MIFRDRGYLPHFETEEATYFVTFRLAGTLPGDVLEMWQYERKEILQAAQRQNRELSEYERHRLDYLYMDKIEKYLDAGMGECYLKNDQIAIIVQDALRYFDSKRYVLHAWCIMPNHVHVLFTPLSWSNRFSADSLLSPIIHSWKSYTSLKANQILHRTGKFWQEEYFDTLVKSEQHFGFYVNYILQNPVAAGLCREWDEWRWNGCSASIKAMMRGEAGGQDARAPSSSQLD